MHLPKSARRTACAAALLVASLAFAGCGSSSKEPEYVEQPVEQLYNNAMDALDEGNYHRAAELFDEVERQHPYSAWARSDEHTSDIPSLMRTSYAVFGLKKTHIDTT